MNKSAQQSTENNESEGSIEPHLIQNLVSRRGLTLMHGPTSSGKTSIAMNLAMTIASGNQWAELKTEKTKVLYVASDANLSCEKKLIACRPEYFDDYHEFPDFHVMSEPVNLVKKDHPFKILINLIEEISQTAKPDLIVFDSLSACMAGADVNDAADISSMLATLHDLQSTYGSAILLVQNTGEDSSREERGHNSLRCAIDTSIAVSTTFRDNPRKLVVTSRQGLKTIDPLWFDLHVCKSYNANYKTSIKCFVDHLPDR